MPSARTLRVLVVDDDRDTAESIATLLTLHGFRATCAFGCDGALVSAAANPPDVALIDLTLPQSDGYEVARRLRAFGLVRSPILIAVTGRREDWNRARAAESGFLLYLVKPVPPDELVSLLRQCEQGRAWTA
jgi:DNA-binding response OmpR family regulator